MSKDLDYDQLIAKAERFLARHNYSLAKQAFEQAAHVRPTADLDDKIEQCNVGIATKQRADLIKRGRKYDKQGKAREALECFQQALVIESEDWLAKKVVVLRDGLSRGENLARIREAERQGNWAAALAACNEAIGSDSDPKSVAAAEDSGLLAKKAELLARAGRYSELIEFYRLHPPHDQRDDYLLGHALARNGQAAAALDRWSRIEAPSKVLSGQMEQLLPLVMAGSDTGKAIEIGYRAVQRLRSPAAESYRELFRCKMIEHYWRQACYREIAELVGPLPERMPGNRLGFYAKLYFQLAEQDTEIRETAVDLWLTAAYNEPLLDSLHAIRDAGNVLDRQTVRKALLERMQAFIDRCREQQPTATEHLVRYWELQRRLIETLAAMDLDYSERTDPFPCTPMFAHRFGLSTVLYDRLRQHQGDNREADGATLELLAYCSESGAALLSAELGEPERALAELPPRSSDPVATYCRRRIALRIGIAKALRGEMPVKKWFQEARPLLEQSPKVAEELIALVYDHPEPEALAALAEGMETLAPALSESKFREATAHALALHATVLHNRGVGDKSVDKILARALTIYPESHLAGNIRREMGEDRIQGQFIKAMKQQNLAKAADIVLRADSIELRDYFFKTLINWQDQVQTWDEESKWPMLHDLYHQAHRVDPNHPITRELGDVLQRGHQ